MPRCRNNEQILIDTHLKNQLKVGGKYVTRTKTYILTAVSALLFIFLA
ncbi:hypothetical protein BH24CHL1_BH24CHL1_01880 [soil metagenome]